MSLEGERMVRKQMKVKKYVTLVEETVISVPTYLDADDVQRREEMYLERAFDSFEPYEVLEYHIEVNEW